MLILGRKEKETIIIGNDVIISVENISKGMVKIGIDAPKEIMILRGELKDRIIESNLKATNKASNEQLQDISKLLKK
ncbi:MAG TPA: carbon storage regulator [Campylobacterales bacterium]|nr:carbon storage regulator [Campylobacterales bacterium]